MEKELQVHRLSVDQQGKADTNMHKIDDFFLFCFICSCIKIQLTHLLSHY